MSALLLLFVCLILGVLVARFAAPPAGTVQSLNWWVLNVALAALVLELIPKLEFDAQLWFPIAAKWLTFGGEWLLGTAAGVGGLVLTVGVLQAAMAPMVSAAILADEYDLEPTLVNTMLGAGIVLSLLTAPLGDPLLVGTTS